MKKIVITGMGAVTPVGIGVDEYWKNITAGVSGIDTIKSFDASELAVQVAGEIKDFTPTDYLEKDLVRKTDPFMQYAYIAAEEALKQSNIFLDTVIVLMEQLVERELVVVAVLIVEETAGAILVLADLAP